MDQRFGRWRDVLVQPEHVFRVELGFHLDESVVVLPISELFSAGFLADEVHIRAVGRVVNECVVALGRPLDALAIMGCVLPPYLNVYENFRVPVRIGGLIHW